MHTRARIVRMNPVAEGLTGWKRSAPRGEKLADVFRVADEATGAPLDPIASVLRRGSAKRLAHHAVLASRDGAQKPIAGSGAPIRDPRGESPIRRASNRCSTTSSPTRSSSPPRGAR